MRECHFLTADEEQKLLARYRQGDQRACERLIESQESLARKLIGAHHRRLPQHAIQELLDDAPLIVFRCIRRYDPARGTRLATTISWGVLAAVGQWQRERARNMTEPLDGLEVAQEDGSPYEAFAAREEAERNEAALDAMLGRLPARWAKVVRMRWFEGLNYREIGEALGVSGERARTIEHGALERLRGFVI